MATPTISVAIEAIESGDQPSKDTAIRAIALLLAIFRMPANHTALSRELPGDDVAPSEIVRLLRRLDLKSRMVQVASERLPNTPMPALARMNNGDYCVIGKVAEGKVVMQDPDSSKTLAPTIEEFDAMWSGTLILVTKRASLLSAGGKFDISWFIPAFLKYRKIIGEVLIASLFLQLFMLVTPLFFQVVMDRVLVHHSISTLNVIVIGMVVIAVFEVLLGGLRTYIFSHTASRIDVELGAKLFRHLLALPISYFQSRRTGEVVARVRELDTLREFITSSALTLVIDLLFTMIFLVVMWFYSPKLTGIVLLTLPCYVLIAVFVTPILRKRVEERFKHGAENQSFLVESVSGAETIKAMSVQPQSQERWESLLAAYVRSSFRASNLGNIAGQAVQLVSKMGSAAILFFGASLVIGNQLTVGQLIAFNMFAGYVTAPVLRLSQLWNDFQQARLAVERLGDILNSPTEPGYNPGRSTIGSIDGELTFDQVTFRYRPDKPETLRRLSFKVEAGQTIGIVGPSGSGKSTLTKLVQRMYVPESGRVCIDGYDLATIDTQWLRTQIGVVLQENLLFSCSVRDNIALADPSMPMDRIVEAAKQAGAHDFIVGLSEGYDTRIEERGVNLSGGQRQRIAIARALVSDPRILILDEATSALDYESESIIQQNMRQICAGRTVLIIAHRLSTVRNADRIFTIEGGQLIEDGTHDELIERNGRYARLCRLQAGETW
ncbi:MAG: type I secretion system permease/ATPase [Burkholderiaceae bacterium]|nr:type I secretion system permease/ATPase [Burkholderiaceae bacterium]